MIRCILLAKSKQEHFVQRARVPEIASSGTYTSLYEKTSILFFQRNCIFHLYSVGTRQELFTIVLPKKWVGDDGLLRTPRTQRNLVMNR